jgi:hypothetical protein
MIASGRSRLRVVLALLAGGALVAGALAVVLLPGLLARRQHELVLRKTQAVVTAVRDLARLETAEFHLERVIDLRDQQQALYGLVQAEDALLLVAAGDVTAGVDLGRLQPSSVQLRDGRAALRLPEPEIFHVRLDEAHTFVYARTTDLLASRDERLEGKARELALSSFARAAREGGILDRARAQAERVVRALLRELGVAEVTITWGPQGAA